MLFTDEAFCRITGALSAAVILIHNLTRLEAEKKTHLSNLLIKSQEKLSACTSKIKLSNVHHCDKEKAKANS